MASTKKCGRRYVVIPTLTNGAVTLPSRVKTA